MHQLRRARAGTVCSVRHNAIRFRRPDTVHTAAAEHGERVLHRRGGPVRPGHLPAPGGTVSSPEIGPKHKPKKLLIGLLCGFAALVVIVAVLAGIFAARQAGEPSTAGGAEVDRLLERYFTYFKADDTDAMLDLFLPEVITYMQDDDTAAGREAALIQLDDWYYDYGKAIDDYYVYDDDSLDASDVREIQRELGVRIDDNVIVACDVTYQNGQDNDFYFEFVQVDGQWYLLFVVE